jgi:hypothetical protein
MTRGLAAFAKSTNRQFVFNLRYSRSEFDFRTCLAVSGYFDERRGKSAAKRCLSRHGELDRYLAGGVLTSSLSS